MTPFIEYLFCVTIVSKMSRQRKKQNNHIISHTENVLVQQGWRTNSLFWLGEYFL